MLKKEVIIDAIEHRNPAYVPWNIELTRDYVEKIKKERSVEDPEIFLGNHMMRRKYKHNVPIPGTPYEKDLFGVTWEDAKDGGDVGNIVKFPCLENDPDDYKFPEVDEKFARSVVQSLLDDTEGRFRMFSITMGYFERLWSLFSMSEALVNMIAEPEMTMSFLDRVEEHHHKLLDIVLSYDEIEAVYFGDDWGQQNGLIMGPTLWKEMIKPGMKRLFERVKSKGKYVVLHSCGDLRQIMPDLIDMGVDVYNTVQPEIYDLDMLKREYGQDLTFYGGISTQQFMPFATPEETKEMTKRVIDKMASGGGYILSPTHAVTPDIPLENVEAMIQVAKDMM